MNVITQRKEKRVTSITHVLSFGGGSRIRNRAWSHGCPDGWRWRHLLMLFIAAHRLTHAARFLFQLTDYWIAKNQNDFNQITSEKGNLLLDRKAFCLPAMVYSPQHLRDPQLTRLDYLQFTCCHYGYGCRLKLLLNKCTNATNYHWEFQLLLVNILNKYNFICDINYVWLILLVKITNIINKKNSNFYFYL